MNNKNIKIGFIVATYKRPILVKRALMSITKEKYKDVEIVIIDDNPGEHETYLNIKKLIKKNVNYIQNIKNLGLPRTRNIGLELLLKKVDYIIFLDDDDFIMPGSLDKAIEYMKKNPDRNWYLCPVKFTEKRKTFINKYLQVNNYVLDYALGINIRGDAAHIIKANTIGTTRFHINKGNHNEFTFFYDLSKKTNIFPIPVLLIKYNYQLSGLTLRKYYDHSIGQIWTRIIRIYYNIIWLKDIIMHINKNNFLGVLNFYLRQLIKNCVLLTYHLGIYLLVKVFGENFTESLIKKIVRLAKK